MTYGKSRIDEFDEETQDSLHSKVAMDITDVLAEDATWVTKVGTCKTQADFLSFFRHMGIPGDKWKSSAWLSNKARLPKEKGGIDKHLQGLYLALRNKFNGFRNFTAWMEGKDKPEKTWTEIINGCETRTDYLDLFKRIGIPDDKWKNSEWLCNSSRQGLYVVIRKKFNGFRNFVAWMEGKEKHDGSLIERVNRCKTPADFLELFSQLGIPGEEWKKGIWLHRRAKLPKEEGGIEKTFSGLFAVISARFKKYANFVAWMEGKDDPKKSWIDKVNKCKTHKDLLTIFRQAGIPGDSWKSSTWLLKTAKLPQEEGGVKASFSGLVAAIRKRFGGHPQFVAWMEGKNTPEQTWIEKVKTCKTPEDFLRLFREIGIPDDEWKKSRWFMRKAKLPKEEGGTGKTLSGLYSAIIQERGGFRNFVAWMEGAPIPAITPPTTPEEATELIRSEAARLGVLTEELLDPEKISAYVRKNPVLKEAINYFATLPKAT